MAGDLAQRQRPIALLHLRISSDRTGEELGVARQREDGNGLIERRDWDLWGEIVENDVSAAGKRRRVDFERLLEVVRSGAVDVVVAWVLDRLTRNARDRLALLEACRDAGVMLAFVRGSDIDPTTPAGRLTFGILGEVAQHEIDQKSDRQKRASLQAAQQGRRVGGRRPFGYDDDGVTVRPDEAAAIRRAYADVVDGVPLGRIARDWNAAGLRSGQRSYRPETRGQPVDWGHDTVRKVLLNPRNIGVRTHLGAEVGPAQWPALVDEEAFRAVSALLSDPLRHSGGTGPANRQMLTGLALCGVCQGAVHGGGATHGKPVYRCAASAHMSRLRDPVDDFVSRVMIGMLDRHGAELLAPPPEQHDDATELRAEAASLRSRMEGLALQVADGDWTPAQGRAMNERLRARLGEVEARQAALGRGSLLAPFSGDHDAATVWAGLDSDRRRGVIDAIAVVHLHPVGRGTRTFRPETVEVRWKHGPSPART